MPPKTRGNRISKASKENIDVNLKSKTKTAGKITRPPRKALTDKTNSASDDNASFVPSKPKKVVMCEQDNLLVKQRPRRDRRVPSRFVESTVLQNLSKSKNDSDSEVKPVENSKTPVKKAPTDISPLKTPKLNLDSSLTAPRPKRICRLPSKFNDHSISPNKLMPVLPSHASTPKIQTKSSKILEKNQTQTETPKATPATKKVLSTKINTKRTVRNKIKNSSKNSADTNNNPKRILPRNKTKTVQQTSPKETQNDSNTSRKPINKNFTFKVLEDTKKSSKRDASQLDVYEFTYDPNEEPPPPKKKKKKPAKKREPKPKIVIFKNNYDRNIAKVLSALKNTVSKPTTAVENVKSSAPEVNSKQTITQTVTQAEMTSNPSHPIGEATELTNASKSNYAAPIAIESSINTEKSHMTERNYNSVRVEDIALDFEDDACADNVNYSPVNSPRSLTCDKQNVDTINPNTPAHSKDPLNLRGDLSFFDDHPVASSSMNTSVRHPTASPWRVEFESLPIKWQVNTYVKPNMTPAVECSFVNFNDSKKKHVYTNIVSDTNEANDLPQIFEDNTSKLKQTSIISFIKEAVEKSAKKKKDKLTPIKSNSLFEDPNNTSVYSDVPVNPVTPKKAIVSNKHVTPSNKELGGDACNENPSVANSNEADKKNKVRNSCKKKKNKDLTYFGFDESESQDQENVSPVKKIDKRKLRALKPRSRAVLQEINQQKGPGNTDVPVAVRSTKVQGSEAANVLFDNWRSAMEPPVFPEKENMQRTDVDITEVQANDNINDDDDESVHLFEDIEFVHNLKAHRKSYGKTKKAVTFRQNSISDSDVPASEVCEQSDSSGEDDFLDLTFKVPAMEPKKTMRKKKTKKQELSKKEKKEVEAWAAGFNSMCEDIEGFDLLVE